MRRAEIGSYNGLLLDTNLMLLYVVGQYSPKQITNFKRTQRFTAEDFNLLNAFVSKFRRFVTTPNILTEVCNLLETFDKQHNHRVFPYLEVMLRVIEEIYLNSVEAIGDHSVYFHKFGLSDIVTFRLAEQNYLVLTDDLPLCYFLQSKNLPAINFNNLRFP